MDKYILCSYGYLVAVMAESAVCVYFDDEFDMMALWVAIGLFVAQHVCFALYAWRVRSRERAKVFMGYDEVQEYNQRSWTQNKPLFLKMENLKTQGKNKYR